MTMALSQEQAAALDVARGLAVAGIPVFAAEADPAGVGHSDTGFWLPSGWNTLAPDPAWVDRWRPGMALCAVMGVGLDLLDVDAYKGASLDALDVALPVSYGAVLSASGGLHSFVASLGAGSRDAVAPGIDVKGGLADGTSRGFAFLPPTVKPSRVDGTPQPYRWITPPDLERLAAARASGGDTSGSELAARIRALRGTGSVSRNGHAPDWYRAFLDNREPQSAAAASRAITEKLTAIVEWTPAAPHNFRTTLLRAAMTLGGYVGGGWLDEGDAWGRLEQAAAAVWGIADENDRKWIEQGLTDGAGVPFYVYTREDEDAQVTASLPENAGEQEAHARAAAHHDLVRDAIRSGTPVHFELPIEQAIGGALFDPAGLIHDQEYAEATLVRNIGRRRYGADSGTWVVRRYSDQWVEMTGDQQADAAVADVARFMPLGQYPVPKDTAERSEEHWQAARRAFFLSSAGAGRVSRKIRALVSGGGHPASVDVAKLDDQRHVLWAGGVPFDLRACAQVPTVAAVEPSAPHLHTARYLPDPEVPTPCWDAFVAGVLPDPEVRAWTLRVLSITLTGEADAAMPVLYGRERSGKSSLIELLINLLGSYGFAASPDLVDGKNRPHPADVYELRGRRLAFVDEGPGQGHHATERIKQFTGGTSLSGAPKYGRPVSFTPTHTLIMTTNKEPGLTDPALRARLRLIPCDQDEAVVRPLRQALTPAVWAREAPGVLAMLMREAAAWLADRDSAGNAVAPAVVRGQVEEMVTGQDPVQEWRELCTVPVEPERGTSGRALHRRFLTWFEGQPTYRRQSPPSETAFGRSLTDQGFPWYWGGPRGHHRYRALSVMEPGGDAPLWAPTPVTSAGFGPRVGPEGSPRAADTSPASPSAPSFPRSTPLSSSSSDTSDSQSQEEEREQGEVANGVEDWAIWGGGNKCESNNGAVGIGASAESGENPAPPAITRGAGSSANPSAPGGKPSEPGQLTAANDVTGAKPPSVTVSVDPELSAEAAALEARASKDDPEVERKAKAAATNAAIARLHDRTGRPKTELRKALTATRKALAREAAIRVASGPVHALPAVVDRTGQVVPIDLDLAGRIVRAAFTRPCTCPAGGVGHLTVDVETSGYPIGHALYELRSVQLGDVMAAVVLHPVTHAALIRDLLAEAVVLHAHSATADLVPAAVAGLLGPEGCDPAVGYEQAWDRMWDTTIPARLADPASTGSDPGLKKLAPAVLGHHAVVPAADEGRAAVFKAGGWLKEIKTGTPVGKSGWAQIETGSETMLRYAASDVLDTAALACALPSPDARVAGRERLAQRMTARSTYRGVRLDPEQIATKTIEHRHGLADATARVREFGIDNPGSDQQVAAKAVELGANLPRTPKGAPSVAAGVLDPLKDAPGPLGAFVSGVLAHRHHETALGLFLAPYADLCEHGDGRARPTVYTLGTNTGRMSCVRPNLQQLSREGGIRACITADPGQTIISADFSGVELRVAAALSGDPNLRQIIAAEDAFTAEVAARAAAMGDTSDDGQKAARKAILAERGWPHAGMGDGLHWMIARQIWGDGATKANRYVAKRIVFGRIYGGGVKNLSAQVGVSVETGQQVLDVLDAITPQLKAWSRSISNAAGAGATRYQAYSGRTIHLPAQTPHAAPNYGIQGTARELLVDALERWADTRWGTATILPVHDELLVFVPAEDAQAATAELVRAMAGDLGGVPIIADPSAPSFAWADST